MSVTLWNAIITVRFPLHHWWSICYQAMCIRCTWWSLVQRACVIKPCVYSVHVLGMKYRKELARLRKQRQRERDGQETCREQARMHWQTSRARETSQQRPVNYDNRCLALSSTILSSHWKCVSAWVCRKKFISTFINSLSLPEMNLLQGESSVF